MAKRPAQQLDLFALATDAETPTPVDEAVDAMPLPEPETTTNDATIENEIIFSNDQISVRIKKRIITPVVTIPVPPAEEPAITAITEDVVADIQEDVVMVEAVVPTIEQTETIAELTVPEPLNINQEENTATTAIAEHVLTEETIQPQTAVPVKPPRIKASVKVIMPAITDTKPKSKRGRKSFKEMDDEVDMVAVPDDEVLNQKLYYSISEVAGWFNVNTSLIRAWENEFDILKPRKNRKGDRLFRVEDIRNLQLIYYLLRVRKFSVDGARLYLKQSKQKIDLHFQLIQSLSKFKSFLLELKANLAS
jgi:DNA-binding transcriptional MerR regulator